MKRSESIGLFFVLALICLGAGLLLGIKLGEHKAGEKQDKQSEQYGRANLQNTALSDQNHANPAQEDQNLKNRRNDRMEDPFENPDDQPEHERENGTDSDELNDIMQTGSMNASLRSDTEYVLEENDLLKGTVVETKKKLPQKYVGMDRETFLAAMDRYKLSPPLKERERGFAGLEVLSFSSDRVVVRVDYRYVQPGSSFYLALLDHQVVAYLEDKETVYIYSGIMDSDLSDDIKGMLAEMIYVENEETLYSILESYSS